MEVMALADHHKRTSRITTCILVGRQELRMRIIAELDKAMEHQRLLMDEAKDDLRNMPVTHEGQIAMGVKDSIPTTHAIRECHFITNDTLMGE